MERQAPDTRYQAPCIPNTCFVCVTIPAYTWTLLSADVRTLDAFQQKCLRQLPGIRWHDRVRSDEVLQRTGLTLLSRLLSRRCISVFGRVGSTWRHTGKHGSSVPHQRIIQPTSWPSTWSSTEQVARPATKRFHPEGPLEACRRPWTWWCNDATALAGYATMMMMLTMTTTMTVRVKASVRVELSQLSQSLLTDRQIMPIAPIH